MKSLMRNYVYGPKMDNDIRDMIEKCKGCAQAVKVPPLLSNFGQEQNILGREYMLILQGPREDFNHLNVVYSYSKWPEVLRCRRPTTGTTIGFLHEMFARFGVCCQRQRKPIHIRRILGVLWNLPNKTHNHTAISPKIKRTGWTFCRHV